MSKKKPYFPNNWKEYHKAPAESFEELPFEQFMDWKVAGWELPASVVCIIRDENLETGKIKEYVYQREHSAKNKVRELMDVGVSAITVVNENTIHYLEPKYLLEDDYDDDTDN